MKTTSNTGYMSLDEIFPLYTDYLVMKPLPLSSPKLGKTNHHDAQSGKYNPEVVNTFVGPGNQFTIEQNCV